MLNDNQIATAVQRIADTFRANVRPLAANSAGWGQFIGPGSGTSQVGLYGTCAGVIAVTAAYANNGIPSDVISFLEKLWANRNDPTTAGPRYFSLTLRLAFFLLALRRSHVPRLQLMIVDVEAELLRRRAADGLFMDWYVSASANSATGKEYTTAIVLLSYAFSRSYQAIPDSVRSAALSMQQRVIGARNDDIISRRLYLAAIAAILSETDAAPLRTLIRGEYRRRDRTVSEYLYFWDYQFTGDVGLNSRRDYFYIPPEVVDVLLATNKMSGSLQRLSALETLQKFWAAIEPLPAGLFYRQGATLAASKDQAWIVLAFSCAPQLRSADNALARLQRAIYSSEGDSWAWDFIAPFVLLGVLGTLAVAPDAVLQLVQFFGGMTPKPTWWEGGAKPTLSVLGIVLLTAMGETLWKRMLSVVRARLP